jgi:hypothetical protein
VQAALVRVDDTDVSTLQQTLSLPTATERRSAERRLSSALSELDRRAVAAGDGALDVQLLVQIAGAPVYRRFRKGWAKAWRREDHSTMLWPESLADDEFAALLLPLPARRPALAAGRHPVLVGDPLLGLGTGMGPGDFDGLALALVTEWAATPGQGFAPRLAPPFVEVLARRGVLDRRIAGFGQDWPLPSPGVA